jgi:hypothetical protein
MAKHRPLKKDEKKRKGAPKVNPELEGFDIRINSFGEISSTYEIDKINEFLNKHVDDKKLRERDEDEEERNKKEDEDDRDKKKED